jgi:hypothetical protein
MKQLFGSNVYYCTTHDCNVFFPGSGSGHGSMSDVIRVSVFKPLKEHCAMYALNYLLQRNPQFVELHDSITSNFSAHNL